jgi:Cu/Ag efflux protein CusF
VQHDTLKGETMKILLRVMATALLVLAFGGNAFAELKAKAVGYDNGKPEVTKERIITKTATVEAVDLKTRIVTLKGDGDMVFDVKVGPEAKNLPQLKKGDEVTVKYYESISAKVYKANAAPKIDEQAAMLETAEKGQKPGGTLALELTITATIEAIDMKKPEVTLKTLEGKTLTAKIEDPKLLDNVKVGDEVVITYTEAYAISVKKAKKKSKK